MSTASVLVDTHILLWILTKSRKLKAVKWLHDFPFWTISPVSILEIRFLQEVGKLRLDLPGILEKLNQDERFRIDNAGLEEICLAALNLSWTRDPFDRLLVAHSHVRSLPLGTVDARIIENYPGVVPSDQV